MPRCKTGSGWAGWLAGGVGPGGLLTVQILTLRSVLRLCEAVTEQQSSTRRWRNRRNTWKTSRRVSLRAQEYKYGSQCHCSKCIFTAVIIFVQHSLVIYSMQLYATLNLKMHFYFLIRFTFETKPQPSVCAEAVCNWNNWCVALIIIMHDFNFKFSLSRKKVNFGSAYWRKIRSHGLYVINFGRVLEMFFFKLAILRFKTDYAVKVRGEPVACSRSFNCENPQLSIYALSAWIVPQCSLIGGIHQRETRLPPGVRPLFFPQVELWKPFPRDCRFVSY